eukprot:gnl/Hemi2/14023_TR4762_c0_g1_i1.p1 gnl/Hemi2/14023_TR4762_c0_g1~~gnl/Hemi2/14023_TR4762_c0_g1_i1.p1  ORF type:complete len:489 (-),score=118.10 gnl/Hemi2/14023_TR4762_c0_g1_i1:73-1509(-)
MAEPMLLSTTPTEPSALAHAVSLAGCLSAFGQPPHCTASERTELLTTLKGLVHAVQEAENEVLLSSAHPIVQRVTATSGGTELLCALGFIDTGAGFQTPRGRLPRENVAALDAVAVVDRVVPDKYFCHLFGFNETVPAVAANIQTFTDSSGLVQLRSMKNNQVYQVGQFATRTIDSFALPTGNRGRGTFSLVVGRGGSTKDLHLVDVHGQQADPENCGATFQVASNFNCLEFVSEHDTADRGISCYVWDMTQGPAASVSAAPATLYRNYFVPHTVNGKNYVGQLEEEINLLHNSPIPVRHGYVQLRKDDRAALSALHMDFRDVAKLEVGVQSRAQVVFGTRRRFFEVCHSKTQVVNQVFTAAMNVAGMSNTTDPIVANIACMLLRAAYRGTILAACERAVDCAGMAGANKCFLTLIGGGVFGNSFSWIVDAILDCEDLILASGLDVRCVLFVNRMSESKYGRLVEFAGRMGGRVMELE